VMLIERQLQAILEHRGVAPIDADGKPFNPTLHEAIAEKETSEVAPDTVTTVLQKGYTMHGRVIRPALVELARRPATPPPEPATQSPTQAETVAPASTSDDPEIIAEDAKTENPGP